MNRLVLLLTLFGVVAVAYDDNQVEHVVEWWDVRGRTLALSWTCRSRMSGASTFSRRRTYRRTSLRRAWGGRIRHFGVPTTRWFGITNKVHVQPDPQELTTQTFMVAAAGGKGLMWFQ